MLFDIALLPELPLCMSWPGEFLHNIRVGRYISYQVGQTVLEHRWRVSRRLTDLNRFSHSHFLLQIGALDSCAWFLLQSVGVVGERRRRYVLFLGFPFLQFEQSATFSRHDSTRLHWLHSQRPHRLLVRVVGWHCFRVPQHLRMGALALVTTQARLGERLSKAVVARRVKIRNLVALNPKRLLQVKKFFHWEILVPL